MDNGGKIKLSPNASATIFKNGHYLRVEKTGEHALADLGPEKTKQHLNFDANFNNYLLTALDLVIQAKEDDGWGKISNPVSGGGDGWGKISKPDDSGGGDGWGKISNPVSGGGDGWGKISNPVSGGGDGWGKISNPVSGGGDGWGKISNPVSGGGDGWGKISNPVSGGGDGWGKISKPDDGGGGDGWGKISNPDDGGGGDAWGKISNPVSGGGDGWGDKEGRIVPIMPFGKVPVQPLIFQWSQPQISQTYVLEILKDDGSIVHSGEVQDNWTHINLRSLPLQVGTPYSWRITIPDHPEKTSTKVRLLLTEDNAEELLEKKLKNSEAYQLQDPVLVSLMEAVALEEAGHIYEAHQRYEMLRQSFKKNKLVKLMQAAFYLRYQLRPRAEQLFWKEEKS